MTRRYRVLLTRPRAESETMAAELAARGIDSVIAPILEIQPTGTPLDPPSDTQALLVTSGNALEALIEQPIGRRLPVYAVGADTAKRAHAQGFDKVEDTGGTAETLIERVVDQLSPDKGPILWVSGEDVRVDLVSRLAGSGFHVARRIVYRAVAVDHLPLAAIDALKSSNLDSALFFSPRTAERFVSLVEKAGLMDRTHHMTAYCLSPAVAEAASAAAWSNIRTARRPTRQDLLATLGDVTSPTAD